MGYWIKWDGLSRYCWWIRGVFTYVWHRRILPAYWVTQSYRVALTREEKSAVGKPSLPRLELDVLAYKPSDNEVLVVECKSYLYSQGVKYSDVVAKAAQKASRYKLFVDAHLRQTVFSRLKEQLYKQGMCNERTKLQLCLAVGKFYSQDESRLVGHFKQQGWRIFTPDWLCDQLLHAADEGYENDSACVVSRLLGVSSASRQRAHG